LQKFLNLISETRSSNLLHVLAVALVLSLVGLAFLAFVHSIRLEKRIRTETPFVIELRPGYQSDSLKYLMDKLESLPGIVSKSVSMIPRDRAVQEMSKEQDLALSPGENPFFDLIVLNLDPEQDEQASISRLQEFLKGFGFISSASNPIAGQAGFSDSVRKVKTVLVFSTLLLALMAFFIIGYLVRIFFQTKAPVIRLMGLLGAEPGKIAGPYTRLAIIHGLASALMAVSMLGLALLVLYYMAPWVYHLLDLKNFLITVVVLLITGPGLHYISIRQSIKSFQI
jgi:cell division transport system permease protein